MLTSNPVFSGRELLLSTTEQQCVGKISRFWQIALMRAPQLKTLKLLRHNLRLSLRLGWFLQTWLAWCLVRRTKVGRPGFCVLLRQMRVFSVPSRLSSFEIQKKEWPPRSRRSALLMPWLDRLMLVYLAERFQQIE